MCGIAGGVGADEHRLMSVRRLSEELIHRGPDDSGEYDDSHCSLAMRRLSIIDLTGGHQPPHNETGDVIVVCNGELYNFESVRARLEKLGHQFATHSDIEVAVHGHESWGDQFLAQINGMFALALWDRARRWLLLARGRLGKKPLYYAETSRGLFFASELRSLLTLAGVRWTIDVDACREFCGWGFMPQDRTPVTDYGKALWAFVTLGVWIKPATSRASLRVAA